VIVRDWHRILNYRVTPDGRCKECGGALAGRFEAFKAPFGPRRVPVRLANFHA
jgi:pyruvate formate lyase activating enzyme